MRGRPRSCNFNYREKAKRAFGFILGGGDVIKGWDRGVATMQQGEVACLVIRHDFAYGEAGQRPQEEDGIPGKSTLRFEVELLGWEGGAKGTGKLGGSSFCAVL